MAEKREPKFRLKLNLFDLIVVLLALAVAAGAVFYLRGRGTTAAEEGAAPALQTVRYTLELEQAYEESAALAKAGDALYERTRKQDLGTVESVEILPSVVLTRDTVNGTFRFVEVPNRKNIKLQVVAQATEREDSITLESGLEIRAGDSLRVCGPGYYAAGYITRMERS